MISVEAGSLEPRSYNSCVQKSLTKFNYLIYGIAAEQKPWREFSESIKGVLAPAQVASAQPWTRLLFLVFFLGPCVWRHNCQKSIPQQEELIPLVPLPAHKFPVARVQNPKACGAKFTLCLEAMWCTLIC